jgi:hypothetical protein
MTIHIEYTLECLPELVDPREDITNPEALVWVPARRPAALRRGVLMIYRITVRRSGGLGVSAVIHRAGYCVGVGNGFTPAAALAGARAECRFRRHVAQERGRLAGSLAPWVADCGNVCTKGGV